VGCEARKSPAVGGVFFLDFDFYRTYEELAESEEHHVPHFPHLHKQMRGLYYVPN
jgi:hypothetical protein